MGLLLEWIFSIVGWILAGIITWNWIQPDSFSRGLLWLILFLVLSVIFRAVFSAIGEAIGSLFD